MLALSFSIFESDGRARETSSNRLLASFLSANSDKQSPLVWLEEEKSVEALSNSVLPVYSTQSIRENRSLPGPVLLTWLEVAPSLYLRRNSLSLFAAAALVVSSICR